MIIFLYGQDSYRLIQYVNELNDRYRKKYPDILNFHKFDLEEADALEVRNAIRGSSFFKQVKFVILKNPFAQNGFIEKIIKENGIEKQKDVVLLLYQAESEEKLKKYKLFGLLAKLAQVKEFKPLTNQAAKKFVKEYIDKNKVTADKEMVNKFVKEVGTDSWTLKNELDKIIGFLKTENKKTIGEDEFSHLVNPKIDSNIFVIVDAVFRDKARALILFENYISRGGDVFYLLSVIASHLKNMIIVRELLDKRYQYSQILPKTKMHPWLFRKVFDEVKNCGIEELKGMFQKISSFEIAVKSGNAEPEDAFFKIFL